MIAALTALLLASTPPACAPISGADQLWKPGTRWVMVGETHGTAEMPAAFYELICLAVRTGRPVYVALEYPSREQRLIDAFLASDGGAPARAALFKGFLWQLKGQDGRASQAFLRLFDQLRVMKQAGQIRGVTAFVPELSTIMDIQKAGTLNATVNKGMADDLKAIAAPDNALILTLVGGIHAMTTQVTFGGESYLPAAALLPRERAISIRLAGNGGDAWNCQATCGPHPNGVARQAQRGLVYGPAQPFSADRFDVTFELGMLTTASPPANAQP
jgi:hypothetical protein